MAAEETPALTETRVFGGTEFRHAEYIDKILITPDGKTLVSIGGDYFCRAWDAESGELKCELEVHRDVYSALVVDQGQAVLLSTNDEKGKLCIERMSLKTGKIDWRIAPPFETKNRFDLSGTAGNDVIVSNTAGFCRLNPQTGECIFKKEALDRYRNEAFLSPDGKFIFTRYLNERSLYNSATFEMIWHKEDRVRSHGKGYNVAMFSRDSATIHLVGNGFACDCDVESGMLTELEHTADSPENLREARLLPDGIHALASKLGKVVLWDLAANKVEPVTTTYSSAFAAFPDGSKFAATLNNRIQIWNLKTKTGRSVTGGHDAPVYDLNISPDGSRVASCFGWPPVGPDGEPDRIRVWNRETGREIWSVDTKCDEVARVLFSADGKTVYANGSRYDEKEKKMYMVVFAWDAGTGKEIFSTPFHDGTEHARATAMELTEYGNELLVATPNRMFVADAKTGGERRSFAMAGYVKTFAVMDHDRILMTGDGSYYSRDMADDMRLRLLNSDSGVMRDTVPSLLTSTVVNTYKIVATPDHRGVVVANRFGEWLKDSTTQEFAYLLFFHIPDVMPVPDAARVQQWIGKLNDDTVDVRDEATRALMALTPSARPLLESALKGKEGETRDRISNVLSSYAAQELPVLQQAMDINGRAYAVDVSSDGTRFVAIVADEMYDSFFIVSGSTPQMVKGTTTPGKVLTRQAAPRHPQVVRFLPDGKSFMTGNRDGTLSLFEPRKND